MEKKIIINEDDIKQAIAEWCDTSVENVELTVIMKDVGYGMSERKEPKIEAVIVI
jgi:hypothetical protein